MSLFCPYLYPNTKELVDFFLENGYYDKYDRYHFRKDEDMLRIYKCVSCGCEITSRHLDNGTFHNEPKFYSISHSPAFSTETVKSIEICDFCFNKNAPKDIIDRLKQWEPGNV